MKTLATVQFAREMIITDFEFMGFNDGWESKQNR